MSNPDQNEYLRKIPTQGFVEDEIDLREYLGILIEARWLILGITAAVFALALIYVIAAAPIYRSDALIQVENNKPTLSGLEDITTALTGEVPSVTEIEIIRSRRIIGSAIDNLNLDIEANPDYFPIFGARSARKFNSLNVGDSLAKPVWGLGSYAWGGERINVQRLDVPREIEGKKLILVAGEGGNYKLYGPDDEILVSGMADKLSSGATEDRQQVNVFISDLHARAGTHFNLVRYSRSKMVEDLEKSISVKEKGLKSGILQIALEGKDPVLTSKIVDSISNAYLRQNVERKSVEAERTLSFLDKQLPKLKSTLDDAETNLNNYRAKSGKIDLTLETQGILDQSADLEKNIQTLQLEKTKLLQRFTPNHPSILGINKQISDLQNDKSKLDKEIKSLPAAEQESVKLTRDVKVANELYLLLLNKAQELKVVKAGTVGNVRILDHALVPDVPIKPKKSLVLLMSLVVGSFLAIVVAFVRKGFFYGLENPTEIESRFGIPVYASILHSREQIKLERKNKHAKSDLMPILALESIDDLSVEALRSLRTSLQFALMNSRNNIIAIGGPAPGIGKSFVSVNLAHVLADTGKRILLIDADMRKGHLHRYFDIEKEGGLSELLGGTITEKEVIKKTKHQNVFFLPCGIYPPNPSELLTSNKFREFLDNQSNEFDLILVDTPPILAVADATIVSQVSGIFFMILKSRKHHIGEIEQSLKRMEHNGTRPQGFILNEVRPISSGYHGYGYSYQYKYK